MRGLLTCVCVPTLLLAGCTTLNGPPPPPAAQTSEDCDTSGARVGSDSWRAIRLGCELESIADRSGLYIARYSAITGDRAMLDRFSLASALSLAGFGLFGAHEDNLRAATFGLGASTALRSGLNQTEQAEIYDAGARAMNCYAQEALTVLDGYNANDRTDMETAYVDLTTLSALARRAANDAATPPADTASLESLVAQADTLRPQLRDAYGAIRRFPGALAISWQAADAHIHDRLAAQAPDIAALIAATRALDPGNNQTGEPVTSGAEDREGLAGTNESGMTVTDITEGLTAAIATAELYIEADYPARIARLGDCLAIAAP